MTKPLPKRFLLPITALLLAACSSSTPQQQSDYRLPLLNQPSERFCSANSRQVLVSDLMLSEGILLQRSATQIHAARHHRWSGSLEQQLQQSVQRQLSQPHCQGTVVIRVMDFYGDDQGNAVVRGHWQYRHQDQLLDGTFHHQQPLASDGYDALVQALNDAWRRSLTDIRNAIPN